MHEAQIQFLFGEVPPGVNPDDPDVWAELLARDPALTGADLALRVVIATQVFDDDPPAVWETAARLLGLDHSPEQVMAQLTFALARATRAAMAEDRGLDVEEFVSSLRWLPLPDAKAVATLLVGLVREQPGITVDDLSLEVLATLGREPEDALALDVFDRVNEALVDEGGPLAWLADDRTVHVGDLVAGCVLTHRLSDEEIRDGVLDSFDLVGFDRLPGLHLATGEPIEPAFDDEGDLGWSGPEGWLQRFGPRSLLSVRVAADGTVSIEQTAEPPEDRRLLDDLRRIYDRAVEESHLPASLEEIALSLLLENREAFALPRLPLGELCEAAGLELRGDEVAHDARLWANAHQLGVLGRVMDRFEKDEDRTAALRALDAATDTTVAPRVLREVMDGLLDEYVIEFVAAQLLGPDEDPAALEQTRAFGERLLRAARQPTEVAVASWLAAVVAERDGRVLDAESHLKRAVEADASWDPALDRAGRYAFDRSNAAEAVALWQRMEDPPKEDLELAREFAAGTPERRVGRNDPCWCGSGRKYKVCHLGRPALPPLPDRVGWLYRKAVAYLEHQGPAAFTDLMLYAEARALDDSEEAMTQALEDPVVTDATLAEGGWFERFLEDRGLLLPDDEALLGAAWALVARTVYEVVELSPGVGMVLRDLRTGDRIEVRERLFSRDARLGLLVCGRAVPDGHTHQFIGSIFAIPPGTENSVLELCDEEDPELLCMYVGDRHRPPRLKTREGEPLVACTTVVDIGNPEAARAWLDDRYEARDDVWVDFHPVDDEERLLRARLVLQDDRLSVFTSSEERMERVLEAIRTAFPAAQVVSDEREPVGPHNLAALAGAPALPDGTSIPLSRLPDALREIQETYEARWIDESIPALGGVTPRQAAADPTRMGELQRLIDSFPDPSALPDGSFALRPDRLRELLGMVSVGGSAGDAQ